MAGAILVQRATWANAERALANLRACGPIEPDHLSSMNEEEIRDQIKPAGCYRAKAHALRAVAQSLLRLGVTSEFTAVPAEILRRTLLETSGLGPETADTILLYAAGHPSFVVDTFTRRLFTRLAVQPEGRSYQDWQDMFMSNLPADATFFGEFHALIVRHGQKRCHPTPDCEECPLRSCCPGRNEHSSRELLETSTGGHR